MGVEIARLDDIVLDGGIGRMFERGRRASQAVGVAPEQEGPNWTLLGELADDRETDLGGAADQQHAARGRVVAADVGALVAGVEPVIAGLA